MEYCAYSDESYITANQYRSIATFSFPKNRHNEIDSELRNILGKSNVKEFKWQKLRNAKNRFCAEEFINFLMDQLFKLDLRIDVLIWDTQDSRHKIQGRDDSANFERMFFHLLKNVMKKREKNSKWYVFPDEKQDIDWYNVQQCLANVGKWREYIKGLFLNELSEPFYHIKSFKQVESYYEPCAQMADLFAGLAVFSKTKYARYKSWCEINDPQMCLFDVGEDIAFSNKEKQRFKILSKCANGFKAKKLGVSLETKGCLCTFDPTRPINFWHYIPQQAYDKAPVHGRFN